MHCQTLRRKRKEETYILAIQNGKNSEVQTLLVNGCVLQKEKSTDRIGCVLIKADRSTGCCWAFDPVYNNNKKRI